ncbi:MAG: T9SS type A sorting domain-containing protein [Chitinophagales bacterium]|nr:T9SS type A sorting domain-containing protein [Chitinophagales bacterium]
MKSSSLLLLVLIQVFYSYANLIAQEIEPNWARFDTTNVDGLYGAPFVHSDAAGNIVVCSNDFNPGPLLSMLTTKYTANGQVLWQQKFDLEGQDDPISSLCDQQNAVYVAGNTGQNSIMGAIPGMVLLKYDANGNLEWSYRYEGPAIGQNYVTKILFDADQNVVVFGNYSNTALIKTGLFAVKLSPDGQVLWSASHVDTDFGFVGVGAKWQNERWVFWGRNSGATGTRYLAWQLTDEGQTITTDQTGLNLAHSPEAVHIGNDGSLYVSTWVKYQLLKFGLDGQKLWEYDKPNNQPLPQGVKARVNVIGTDSTGNVFVYGSFRQPDGLQLLSTKINPQGSLEWEHTTMLNGNRVLPSNLTWLNDSTMLVASTVSTVADSNFYEFAFLLYNRSGFIGAGFSDLEGRRNAPKNMVIANESLYVAGISDQSTFTDPRRQILCKYDLNDLYGLVSTSEKATLPLIFWPNPASDWVKFYLPQSVNISTSCLLELRDAMGRRVYVQKMARGEAELSLEHLPIGLYLLSLTTSDGGVYVGKVIKQ